MGKIFFKYILNKIKVMSLCGQGKQRGESGVDVCNGSIDWGYWLLVMLTPCMFTTAAYSVLRGILKSRSGASWLIVFFLYFCFSGNISDCLLLYIFFFGGICFVSWLWCSEPLCRKQLYYFYFCFLSVLFQQTCKVNLKEI